MKFMVLQYIFWINAFIIGWGMIGYRLSLKILSRIFKHKELEKDYDNFPKVSVIIVAHNEEKVIREKLENVTDNDYPDDKIEYIVASDFSTDLTNTIVEEYIAEHCEIKMSLYCSKEHKGKTNAQNEAQKKALGEILIMTDANAIFEKNAISELVASFTSNDIVYVTGKLKYVDSSTSTMHTENTYWKDDLEQRKIESDIKTITAGNGAIYACRNNYYYDFDPIECHDSAMPRYYGQLGLRCIYNPDAIAYEKTGQTNEDEFKRKVRMNRNILNTIPSGLIIMITTYKHWWFSYFYFGHRTCRYLLWFSHMVVLIISLILSFDSYFMRLVFILQVVFYFLSIFELKKRTKNKLLNYVGYYTMTIVAQMVGAFNQFCGKSKPIWDKVDSTR